MSRFQQFINIRLWEMRTRHKCAAAAIGCGFKEFREKVSQPTSMTRNELILLSRFIREPIDKLEELIEEGDDTTLPKKYIAEAERVVQCITYEDFMALSKSLHSDVHYIDKRGFFNNIDSKILSVIHVTDRERIKKIILDYASQNKIVTSTIPNAMYEKLKIRRHSTLVDIIYRSAEMSVLKESFRNPHTMVEYFLDGVLPKDIIDYIKINIY